MTALTAFKILALTLFAQANDAPSVHGMLLFGSKHTYISHLPMFHSPHDYQLLAQLVLPPEAEVAYRKSLAAHPEETIYTLVPERFSLPEMAAHPKPFHAVLYRGHFERGGIAITQEIEVSIASVLHFRKFAPGASRPKAATYLLFGEGEELFSAHFISAKPDFDLIGEVSLSLPFSGERAEAAEAAGHSDLEPLQEGTAVAIRFLDGGKEAQLKLKRVLYLETEDLK